MPAVLAANDEAMLAEVRAYLRAESATRKTWRRRSWLGRRAAFARLEAVILEKWRTSVRSNDQERHALVASLMDALEDLGALDLVTAGSWAEKTYDDPTEATRPVEVWQGQPTPASTVDYVASLAAGLNKRPARRVR